MRTLMACSSCERYVHTHEASCPFCGAPSRTQPRSATPDSGARIGADPEGLHPPARRSRAAAFALRTAVIAGATGAALACGDGARDRGDEEPARELRGQQELGEESAAARDSATDPVEGDRTPACADAGADPAQSDGGFVPVPIYGGVFPDPMSRARV